MTLETINYQNYWICSPALQLSMCAAKEGERHFKCCCSKLGFPFSFSSMTEWVSQCPINKPITSSATPRSLISSKKCLEGATPHLCNNHHLLCTGGYPKPLCIYRDHLWALISKCRNLFKTIFVEEGCEWDEPQWGNSFSIFINTPVLLVSKRHLNFLCKHGDFVLFPWAEWNPDTKKASLTIVVVTWIGRGLAAAHGRGALGRALLRGGGGFAARGSCWAPLHHPALWGDTNTPGYGPAAPWCATAQCLVPEEMQKIPRARGKLISSPALQGERRFFKGRGKRTALLL